MITQGVDAVLSAVRPILSRWWRHHRRHVEEDSKVRLGRLKRFSLQELQVATDNFSKKNIVGVGGFGKVYIGKLADSSLVAVKRILEHSSYGQKEFQAEVDMINYIGFHRNILRLVGFCRTAKEQFLVYPFMANDNLASHLRGYSSSKPPLDWPTRMRIALGSARGLSFLHEHCNPKIIHRDIKPSNIFLNEEFEAALGHFWLAIQMDVKDEYVITDVCGAIGYIAPEYMLHGKSSEKSDVFQYGITLLELITGRRAFSFFTRLEPDVLQDWVKGLLKDKRLDKLIDPDLENNYVETEVEFLIRVALLCTQGSPVDRPRMSEIVRMLEGEGLAERWQEWQDLEVAQVTQQDQHLQAASPYGNNYSNYNHSAIELSGPR